MRLKFFTVPVFDSGEAEAELNRFLAQHRVLKVDRGLVTKSFGACWAVCVGYQDAGSAASSKKRHQVDYRDVLPPEEFELYAELRRWRKETASDAGVPPYQVFTNEQLATIVQKRVQTSESLAQVQGIGPARLAKYGSSLIDQFGAKVAALGKVMEREDAPAADSS